MAIRFASFNASLNRAAEGALITDLSTPDNAQAQAIAEIIQRSNPDVVLINEFDYDAAGTAAALFQENYLSVSQNGVDPVEYPYVYAAPSNTGVPSGLDLNNDGTVGGPDDAYGFGFFPGQFAFVIYSKYPIVEDQIRTFQDFLWADMPGALLPSDPNDADGNGDTASWFTPEELAAVRLSSKNHVDLPVEVNGEIIHVLASHPTPPVFDGPEDRNGRRNYDEIRFWSDYIDGADYIYDDSGNFGGLAAGARFVIMGDQNSDPFDGDSIPGAAQLLLENPLVNTSVTPSSAGGVDAAARQGGVNADQLGNPAFDTADFGFNPADPTTDIAPGNLRVDYVLPSDNLEIVDAQVFWQPSDDSLFPLAEFPTSDHRLVYVDVELDGALPEQRRTRVSGIEFLGEVTFPTGLAVEGTEFGGISGLAYNPSQGVYYALSDDRSQINPARFYTLDIDLSDGSLDGGDVEILSVTTLLDQDGSPFGAATLDPEGIAFNSIGTLFISSEGDATAGIAPSVSEFSLTGEFIRSLPVDDKFLPTADQSSGSRNNLAFESLTLSPSQQFLYTATENALYQDGPAASLEEGSLVRVVQYDLTTGTAVKEFVYETDAVAAEPVPADGFSTNGLVELLALDNTGTLLSLERSFSAGAGNTLRLYEVLTQLTTDIQSFDGLIAPADTPFDTEPDEPFGVDAVAEKELLLDFSDLGLTLDNGEALALGPVLSDGRQVLLVASDNNFSTAQFTQFLAFAVDTQTVPAVPATLETPPEIRFGDPASPDPTQESDPDDPAIYVHPTDPARSFAIMTLKNTGLKVYDLAGNQLQEINPEGVRYNNVDIIYNFELGGETVDLAVASDRGNDTLSIFRIDPDNRQLTDITAAELAAPAFSIFGVDDGEQTAYGLATYTSIQDGSQYVFTTQRDGAQVAQLRLADAGNGTVTAEVIRTLPFEIPADADPEDFQSEGIVIDREMGVGYVALEGEVGILKFDAEPNSSSTFTVVASVDEPYLRPDIEGLTIYYGANGSGYLLASSQGDSTFAVFDRQSNAYLGSFAIGNANGVDAVEESDGADVINVPLGDAFPNGLLIVQDGSNEPGVVFQDLEDGEIQNFSANFKYIDWADVVANFDGDLSIDTTSYNPRGAADTLPNGVASGDVSQDSVVLWTRSTALGAVTFEYSTDADFSSIAGTVTAIVTDGDVPVKVDVDGLDAGTEYFFRVIDAAGNSKTGRFLTAAEQGEFNGFTFGIAGDWQQAPPYPILSSAAERNLDVFVKLGDTIYADSETPALPGVTQARTLEEFRIKHSEILSPRFGLSATADLQATTSIIATIDDHELVDNFAGGAAPGESPDAPDIGSSPDPLFTDDVEFVNDTQAYEDALQAYQEYQPIRDEFYGATGDDRTAGERQLYRAQSFGSDASIFVTDSRSFRDVQLAPANIADPTEFLVQAFDPSRTLLGHAQLDLLKADLLAAQENGTTWKFVVIPEPIQNFGVANAEDRFEGYAAERTELLSFIDQNAIDNVVFMAGDFHGTIVNNLTYQLGPAQDQIATNAFEIVTGPVAFFDGRFGPNVIDIAANFGLITPEQRAFYDALPVNPDLDDIPDDKDDFLKQVLVSQTDLFGYDPVGLNNNLAIADGLVNATLLQGDYVSAHTFSWTELDIDAETQKLTVTTYGIDAYSEADLLANPQAVLDLTPRIVSQFEVLPTLDGPAPLAELIDLTGVDGDVALNVTASREATFDNVLRFYETDAQGRVDGLMVGDAGYEAAVVANLLDTELFADNLATTTVNLTLPGGTYYAPVLLVDGETSNLTTIGESRIQRDGNVWRFEDLFDNDFNDLVITLNSAESAAV
ncbi:phytase [filamentous cyanobacterium CCT1]|nr:phytase [filamentous cyanobacterium CCT1]PSN79735.1 phytase [filamentous cyanobacterium CCP4]